MYLLRCFGRALSSTANILETKTITGALSDDVQARKSEEKKKEKAIEKINFPMHSSKNLEKTIRLLAGDFYHALKLRANNLTILV